MALLLLISSVWYSYLLLTLANAVPIQNEAVILTVPIRQDYNWNITIGNPPQSFTVKLLISGVVSFVPSVQCNTDECMDHSRYDSSKSKTYKADGTKYETNSQELIRGFVSKDSICLSDICINEHPFVEATVVATWDGRIFFNENVDGILSIGISKSGIPTFLDKLFEQKKIPRKVVSIWHEWFSNTTGEVTIGGINEKRYDGTLNWTAFTSDNHWSMPMVKLDQIRSQNGTLGCKDRCDMIVTQELPIFGPTDEVEQINKYIGAKCGARCIVPCDQIAQLPKITFVLGETKLRLTGEDYIIRMRENYCQSAFMPFEADLWFIGEPIIRRYYTVFDFEKNLVGFANKIISNQ